MLPFFRFILLVQNQIFVLNNALFSLNWFGRGPNVSVGPLEPALEILPGAELGNIASNAQVLAELRLIMDAQRQMVKPIIIRRAIRVLAVLVLRIHEVHDVVVLFLGQRPLLAIMSAINLGGYALKHLAHFIKRLNRCKMLHELLLMVRLCFRHHVARHVRSIDQCGSRV